MFFSIPVGGILFGNPVGGILFSNPVGGILFSIPIWGIFFIISLGALCNTWGLCFSNMDFYESWSMILYQDGCEKLWYWSGQNLWQSLTFLLICSWFLILLLYANYEKSLRITKSFHTMRIILSGVVFCYFSCLSLPISFCLRKVQGHESCLLFPNPDFPRLLFLNIWSLATGFIWRNLIFKFCGSLKAFWIQGSSSAPGQIKLSASKS